jgi:hypothetical protein
MRAAAALLPAVLAGCVATAPPPPPAATELRLAQQGLDVAGTGLEIGFGRARDGAVAAVTRLLRRPPDGTARADCSSGRFEIVRWTGALSMHFRDGAFLGWTAPPHATALFGPDTPASLRAGQTCGA